MAPGTAVYRGRHVIVSFHMDRAGIAKIAMGPKLQAAVLDLAETTAKPYAERISPRSDRQHIHYADSFVVVPGTAWIAAMKRVAARLFNTAPHAAAVEWGSAKNGGRGQRILGQTLDHLNSLGHDHN
jgi:hypothetical protein